MLTAAAATRTAAYCPVYTGVLLLPQDCWPAAADARTPLCTIWVSAEASPNILHVHQMCTTSKLCSGRSCAVFAGQIVCVVERCVPQKHVSRAVCINAIPCLVCMGATVSRQT